MDGPAQTEVMGVVQRASGGRRLARVVYVATAVFVFILALELLKTGAGGVGVVLKGFRVDGMLNTLGFGWLMAYLVMSGSPVAALSLSLFAGGTLSPLETFAMINGSRFGASFVVLFVGFIYYLRGIRGRGVVSMGVLSMITTATIYLPAMLLGTVLLRQQWLGRVHIEAPGVFTSILDIVYRPIVDTFAAHVHLAFVFGVGFACLIVSFRLFDRALPTMDSGVLQTRWGGWLGRGFPMFLLGLVVTSITLSVSASLSVLVPLAGRGYVRREHVIPYIMGANISTFVDTLFASLLVGAPLAFTIVLTEMVCVAAVSALVLATVFEPYRRALLAFNELVTTSRTRFALFVGFLAAVPLILLLI